jgi:hypothetical protein
MDWLISEDLAREVGEQLQRMNRGYWTDLYWETQDDGAAMLVRITIYDEQNNEENIAAICWILRTVLATLLPSRTDGTTWVGACNSARESTKPCRGACGGMAADWRTLGMHGGIDDDEPWRKMFGQDIDSK